MSHTLKQVDDSMLSIKRKRHGRGFQYYDEHSGKIKQPVLLRRLKALVIPPMWSDVNICRWHDGHIQATGRDQKGRKQYIYHSEWERLRQGEKFAKLALFGQQLPKIRSRCLHALKQPDWPKNKVLGLMLLILDQTGIRIGNSHYTKQNASYGLSTLRRKHFSVAGKELIFTYQGKSHQQRQVTIDDTALIKHIRQVAEQPGYDIFRYQDAQSKWQDIDSCEVNDYLRALAGDNYSCKDFRTWVASRLAVEHYPRALIEIGQNPRRKLTNVLLRFVADELGNTPSVCKDYYIHPQIMQLIDQQTLANVSQYRGARSAHGLSAEEKLLLASLKT